MQHPTFDQNSKFPENTLKLCSQPNKIQKEFPLIDSHQNLQVAPHGAITN
uniref:Uncharacterized protein n=1 Tax=Rhizophora mucronata TaxID=61149 RepID=A0A2P2Q9J4_RHIMU